MSGRGFDKDRKGVIAGAQSEVIERGRQAVKEDGHLSRLAGEMERGGRCGIAVERGAVPAVPVLEPVVAFHGLRSRGCDPAGGGIIRSTLGGCVAPRPCREDRQSRGGGGELGDLGFAGGGVNGGVTSLDREFHASVLKDE